MNVAKQIKNMGSPGNNDNMIENAKTNACSIEYTDNNASEVYVFHDGSKLLITIEYYAFGKYVFAEVL